MRHVGGGVQAAGERGKVKGARLAEERGEPTDVVERVLVAEVVEQSRVIDPEHESDRGEGFRDRKGRQN